MNDSTTPQLHVGVIDTGAQLNEFPAAQAGWQEGGQKHTTYVIDESGEEHTIIEGKIVFAVPPTAETPDIDALTEQRSRLKSDVKYNWAQG